MANKDLTIRLKVQNLISAGLSDAQKHLGSFAKGIGSNLMNVKAGFDMIKGSLMSFYEIAKKPIQEAFKFETATVQFKILFGNIDLAKKHMADLAHFAAKTPFELGELVDASKILHQFSDGALNTVDSLRVIGDAAAFVGEPFQEVAFWIGRAYSAIKSGEPFGRAAMRLQELKLLTQETRDQMERFQASGVSNIEIWKIFEKSLGKFNGGMLQLSKTGDGLTSTLRDDWTAAVRDFGNEFSEQAKGGIKEMSDALTKMVDDGTVKKLGSEGAQGMNEFMSYLKPTIAFLADIYVKSERIRESMGIGWKSIILGPMGSMLTQLQGIKKEAGNLFEALTGKEVSFSGNTIEKNMVGEEKAVEDKNKKITTSDKRTNEQRIADDMKRSQAFLDNQKKEEQRKKDQEELDKYLTKQNQDRLADEITSIERLRDERTKAALQEIEEAEERAQKLKEISADLADERHKSGLRELEDQLAIDRKKFESFDKTARMTVKEYLAQSQEQENADKEKNKELGKFNRLWQLSSTGAKLSAKDQKFFDAFREKERAKMEAGKLLPNIMGAQQRLDEARSRDADMAMINLEKKFDELMKQR